jgi:hypothetical protein
MSHLSDHARAARFLSIGAEMAAEGADPATAALLQGMAVGYRHAAEQMEAAVRADIVGHACTIDHRAMGSTTCPACKAPRG